MKIRRLATGTLLAASLLAGSGSLAAADGARPAMDRGAFPCEQVEHRLAGLHQAQDALAAHHARIEARLADAQADGDAALVARLERRLAHVEHAQDHLAALAARVQARYDAHCVVDPGPNE